MIEFINLSAKYKTEIIFKEVSFNLIGGQVVSLMGPSGCGKSTLLRLLMGMGQGVSGTLILQGEPVSVHDWKNSNRFFSIVPQVPQLLPWKTVFQNIEVAVPLQYSKYERSCRVDDILKKVQLENHAKKYPFEISQGMAARVSFARALMLESKCILFDEPFAALDAVTRYELQIWLADHIQKLNVPAVFVTHDPREAIFLSKKIFLMSCQTTFSHKLMTLISEQRLSEMNPEDIVVYRAKLESEIFEILTQFKSTGESFNGQFS